MLFARNPDFTHFENRKQAGILLSERLIHLADKDSVVLAIPRGGLVVGREIALRLNAELDMIITKKLGAPGEPELAIGSVAEDGKVYRNEELINKLMISEEYIEKETKIQLKNLSEKTKIFSKFRKKAALKDRAIIITDDGIATGATMISAINYVKTQEPKSISVALPVGPPETVDTLAEMVNNVICLIIPEHFMAVGEFYKEFDQVSDLEVIEILKEFSDKKRF